jgi:Beta-glucanase/Beta-glucan synthetase
MKNKRLITLSLVVLSALTIIPFKVVEAKVATNTTTNTISSPTSLRDGFDAGYINTQTWMKSNGWTNGGMFNCTWRSSNVNLVDGKITLSLTKDTQGGNLPYAGGEFRTNSMYGYGKYQVSMKPAKNTGVVSSFFSYTGPSDNNPWDEIDIEFLGKDTTKVQFNYFTNGVGHHEYIYDLGFDASQSYHTYAYYWRPDFIAWYVDGKEVYRATQNIPTHPGKVMMNLWPGIGVDSWLGAYDGKTPITASYDWMAYDPM